MNTLYTYSHCITLFFALFNTYALEHSLTHLDSNLRVLKEQINNSMPHINPVIAPDTPQKLILTVATVNILHEQYYTGFLEANGVLMNTAHRAELFRQALQDPQQLLGCDIVCLQEWPYSMTQVPKAVQSNTISIANSTPNPLAPHVIATTPKQSHLNAAKNSYLINFNTTSLQPTIDSGYTFVRDNNPTGVDGVAMLINTKKFTILHTETHGFDKSKKYMLVIVESIDSPGIKIGVVSAHIPFSNQIQLLTTITTRTQAFSNVTGWVVCGDFNYDIWDSANTSINTPMFVGLQKAFPTAQWLSTIVANPMPTAFSNYNFNYIDYIFFTNNFTLTQRTQFPSTIEQLRINLIKHKNNVGLPWFYNHFSDHAIIRAQLELPLQRAGQQSPNHQPANISTVSMHPDFGTINFGQYLNNALQLTIQKINPTLKPYPDYFRTIDQYSPSTLKLTLSIPATVKALPDTITLSANPIAAIDLLPQDNYSWAISLTLNFDPATSSAINKGVISIGSVTKKPIETKGKKVLPSNESTYSFFINNNDHIQNILAAPLKNKTIKIAAL